MEPSRRLNLSANENTTLETRDGATHFMFLCVCCHIGSSVLSLAMPASLDAAPSSSSGICRDTKGPTPERDGVAVGRAVHVSAGKFSGPGPDGTCGSVGSRHCFVSSIWGWTLVPMPSQHRKSSATASGGFQARGPQMVVNQQRVTTAN